MPDHTGKRSGFNTGRIDFSIGRIPFLTCQIINACYQMLIPFILSVPRKMFNRCRNSQSLYCIDISRPHSSYPLWIRTKSPCVGNGITEICVNIYNGSKRPVRTDCLCFPCANCGEFLRHLRFICCRHFQRRAKQSSFLYDSVSPFFQICRYK